MNSNQLLPGQQQVGWLSLNHLLEVQPQHCLLGSQSNESWYLCNCWSENTKRKAMGNALVADLTKKHELTTVRQHTNLSKYQTMAGMRGVLFASDGRRGFCWSRGSNPQLDTFFHRLPHWLSMAKTWISGVRGKGRLITTIEYLDQSLDDTLLVLNICTNS